MKTTILYLIMSMPVLCCCTQAKTESNSPFEYKEIYLADALGEKAEKLGLNTVDNDWGIWGHNLKRVLPKTPSALVYASVGGQRTMDQFCFSSPRLYEYIENYIADAYGENDSHRFAILPNDNDIVCQCAYCKRAGVTGGNASPAVLSLIERLAKRFPNHLFFTSHYSTTKTLPEKRMPENTGVLVSAINYHLCAVDTKEDEKFGSLLRRWSEKVNHVYVWDYLNNFDDYFTPFPILSVMHHRLNMYVKNNVKGVFLNGSGNDFSTLQRLHTMVLTDLLEEPNQNVEALIRKNCEKLFPSCSDLVADFVICQEQWTSKEAKRLPMYDGVKKALKTYLPQDDFVKFYEALTERQADASGEEADDLWRMCGAMALTRLEMMRLEGNTDGCDVLLDRLSELSERGVGVYSESCWKVDTYVSEYKAMVNHAKESKDNLLKGRKLVPMSKLDDEYNDIGILTDGLWGLPSNYHCGHLISSATPALKIAIAPVSGMKKIRVSLINNAIFHIILPEKVTLSSGGIVVDEVVPVMDPEHPERTVVELDVPASSRGTLMLSIVRNTSDRTMAIDEIEGF